MSNIQIKSALISVYHKDNLDQIIKQLEKLNVKIYSTGGTYDFIKSLGVKAKQLSDVESVTSYPSILGGRVKTLHPKIFGGILGRRENKDDLKQMKKYDIPQIDLVIVDLYPFEATVASTKNEKEIIEKIDIGGISLIRAAAKNYKDVVIIPSADQYTTLSELLSKKKGKTSLDDRYSLALQAFKVTSHYDTAIFNYFNRNEEITVFKHSILKSTTLRYGENPHQKGTFYGDLDKMFDQLHGKELSYNNLVDIDAAVNIIDEFKDPAFAILKHTNPCGCAVRPKLIDAWKDALAGDPVSAFGGVISTNRKVDKATAAEMNSLFFEVLIAPDFDKEALEIFKQKKNRILLKRKNVKLPAKQFKTILNGVVEQDIDKKSEKIKDFKPVTKVKPTAKQLDDLVFANVLVKHTKSNTIVFAKNNQLIGSGVGQTSRVDATKHAIIKANEFGFDIKGAVMASDAFFPFPDCVEIAFKEGIRVVSQPGGSIKDELSIDFCNKNKIAMLFTGIRHFKH